MAINNNQQTVGDYNSYTLGETSNLLMRFSFVWKNQDTLPPGKFIVHDGTKWSVGDISVAKPTVVLSGASENLDISVTRSYKCQLTENFTITDILNFPEGANCVVLFIQDGTGGRGVSWPDGVRVHGTLNTDPNTVTIAKIKYISGIFYVYYDEGI
jgi:hypothetical protein